MKLLLTSVFGPYGEDDDYGRKENIMEVIHNQVTREQGVFSIRFNQETYDFHLISENLTVPTKSWIFPRKNSLSGKSKKLTITSAYLSLFPISSRRSAWHS